MELEEKQRFMNNSKWKQRKKVFLDRFPQIENRKTEKFIPPAEKQLSYLELTSRSFYNGKRLGMNK